MTEKPQGMTNETCKEDGTYACQECGAKQYYADGEPFGPCPETGREARWVRTT